MCWYMIEGLELKAKTAHEENNGKYISFASIITSIIASIIAASIANARYRDAFAWMGVRRAVAREFQ